MKCIDITGRQFSRLFVLTRAKNRNGKVVWKCRCSCGKISYARTADLNNGKHKSCGCLQLESVTIHGATKHGGGRTPEYTSWIGMNSRCYNPNKKGNHRYSGRGIIVCSSWRHSFSNFLKDMGLKPTPKHSIDRIDNDSGYCQENCKWSTPKEQAQNRIYVRPTPRNRGRDGRFLAN